MTNAKPGRIVPSMAASAIALASLVAYAATSAPKVSFDIASPPETSPGATVQVIFEASLPDGYHVNSDAPLDEFLKPTRLLLEVPDGVYLENIAYPPASLFKTRFAEEPLAVFERTFSIGASLRIGDRVKPGEYPVHATLKYQACSERVCYPPATRSTEIVLIVE